MSPQSQGIQSANHKDIFELVDIQIIEKLEIEKSNKKKEKTDSNKTISKVEQNSVSEKKSIDSNLIEEGNSIYQWPRPNITQNENQNNKCIIWENYEFNRLFNDVHNIGENFYASVKDLKVIGITSAQQNEGSSTVLSLIAQMISARQDKYYWSELSGSGKKGAISVNHVKEKRSNLLIDTQFMNPILHKKFGVSMKSGLYDLLYQGIPLQEVIKNISVSLKLITLGYKHNSSFPKLDVEKFKSFLDFIKPHFKFIFLDIPPILHYSEGLPLCKLCDGIVLVIHAGKTRWEIVQEANRLLKKIGVNVIGGILNKRKYFIPDWCYRRL